jgi:hypothetical protein
MHTIGVLLLAAATAGDGFGYDKPGVGFKKLLRPHVVMSGPAPPGGPIAPGLGGPGGPGGPGGHGGPGVPGGIPGGRRFPNVKSQIYFLDPDGMKIGWQSAVPGNEKVYLGGQLTVPARYNFLQGYIYRLKLTDIPGRPGVVLYPTIEVAPSTPATDAYLTHNPIPVQFTPEDFDQVIDGGNFVTKVIYLPDPKFQELAIAGVETLVSTRLEPGVDPILEADRRGTILLIVRLGAIDLEMQGAGASGGPVMAPGAVYPPGTVVTPPPGPGGTALPPGSLPPGGMMVAPIDGVKLETAPAAPVTPAPPAPAPAPPAAPAPATPPVPAPETPPVPPAEVPAPAP